MNRNVVITGGEGDLATTLKTYFQQKGWSVEAPGRGQLDVTEPKSVVEFFKTHTPDLLICNAGVTADGPLLKMSPDVWDRVLAVNLTGAARCAKAASKSMLRQRRGHLLFVSSHSAFYPPAGQVAYAAAKAGLIGLAKSLALELGPGGIRSNVVLPGFLETRMTVSVCAKRRAEVLGDHSLGRFNTPEAVARFIWFLEEHLPHTSGQVFQLDSR